MLVDSVKLTEEEILELKLSVLADKEAVLDACEVDGLTDEEMEKLTEDDVLVDSVKLTEDKLKLKLTALADEEAELDALEVDGLTDEEME